MRIYKNDNRSCIYALFKNEVIVYIGQSINPYSRIGQHTKNKEFDLFRLMPCLKKRLAHWEDYLIYKYQPKYNILGKKKGSRSIKQVVTEEPKVEYECEPLFIDSNTNNIGFGYSSTTGSRLVIDSGNTFQSLIEWRAA